MKIKELRQKSKEELLKLLQDKKSKAVQFKIGIDSGNVKNVRELRETRKDIARINTLLKENSSK
ncbi:MAG: 50S ribosomal protein L29 [Candidatus Spechtbacteria bacterium RIFCSPLOWO2_02_FULL_38_8]|uniref:Large ribosomal subunit protein uL29 n=1 Tax=Candidatus Spechtbacteria bacterium RIFCSPLOWO2_02_FULL_38_8 TaxID=1802164 RepID=A0A1G2HGS3_9BACT|nr:MAG: 50S ribosomal protein L29 [Candidatus Spechtbacteria bacterium RIFCSPLOWO2_02_FULL_38_8]